MCLWSLLNNEKMNSPQWFQNLFPKQQEQVWYPSAGRMVFQHKFFLFTFPSEKLNGRVVSPSVNIITLPPVFISLLCQSSRFTDFSCNSALSVINVLVSLHSFLNLLGFFVCSPSQTKLNPLFFLSVYIPCRTFLPLSWTDLLLVISDLVCCFVNLPGAS